MLKFGLKAKFSINLLIILLVAMLMLDFVIMMITRQALIQAESEKARLVITALEALVFPADQHGTETPYRADLYRDIDTLLRESKVVCGRLEDRQPALPDGRRQWENRTRQCRPAPDQPIL